MLLTLDKIEGFKMITDRYYFGMFNGADDQEEYRMRDALFDVVKMLIEKKNDLNKAVLIYSRKNIDGLTMLRDRYFFGMFNGADDQEEYRMRDALFDVVKMLEKKPSLFDFEEV